MSRIKVTQKFKLAEGVESVSKETVAYISSGYNYAASVGTIIIDADTSSGLPWESLYNAYSDRRFMLNDYRRFSPYPPLPAYETYDFEDYSTQVSFINQVQSFCTSVSGWSLFSSGSQYRTALLRSVDVSVIEAQTTSNGNVSTWSWMKTESGIPNGFNRYISGSLVGYGNIQTGDDVGVHLFNDIDSVFKNIIYCTRQIAGNNNTDQKFPQADPTLGGPLNYEVQTIYNYGSGGTADGNASQLSCSIYTYASDPLLAVQERGYTNINFAETASGVQYGSCDMYMMNLFEQYNEPWGIGLAWDGYVDASKNFSIVNSIPAITTGIHMRQISGMIGVEPGDADVYINYGPLNTSPADNVTVSSIMQVMSVMDYSTTLRDIY